MTLEHVIAQHAEFTCPVLIYIYDVIVQSLTGKALQFVLLSCHYGIRLIVEKLRAILPDRLKGHITCLVLQVNKLEERVGGQSEISLQLCQLSHVRGCLIAELKQFWECHDTRLVDEIQTAAYARQYFLAGTRLYALIECFRCATHIRIYLEITD